MACGWSVQNARTTCGCEYTYCWLQRRLTRTHTPPQAATLDGWKAVPANQEVQLAAAVMLGPVSVAIEADQAAFQHYKSGIFNDKTCGEKVDHGVLVASPRTWFLDLFLKILYVTSSWYQVPMLVGFYTRC